MAQLAAHLGSDAEVISRLAGRTIGASDDLHPVPRGVLEVDAPSAVISIDLIGQCLLRIGPMRDPAGAEAAVDRVEARVVDKEGVVLHLNVGDVRFGELDEDAVVERDDRERSPQRRRGETEELREERRGLLAIPRGNDCVIEGDGHASPMCYDAPVPGAARRQHATQGNTVPGGHWVTPLP